jgi:hypothetical protein
MPYGFPSGDELKQSIISSLQSFPRVAGPGTQLDRIMHDAQIEPSHVEHFRDTLAGASHITIDRFLQNRPEFERIGKLAIAATLIPCEPKSVAPMFKPWEAASTAQERAKDGWYKYFAEQLKLSSTDWGAIYLQ